MCIFSTMSKTACTLSLIVLWAGMAAHCHSENNIYSSVALSQTQNYTGNLANHTEIPFQFSGTTGRIADTYFVSPTCIPKKYVPWDLWIVYPDYVDDISSNVRLTIKLDGDSRISAGYRGSVIGNIKPSFGWCTIGYHYTSAITGHFNVKFNVLVTPIDSSKPVPVTWTSSIPLRLTDTYNREGPGNGWGDAIIKQPRTGEAIINFTSIDYCNTFISPDVFTHEQTLTPGKFLSGISRLQSICNGTYKLRYRLLTTGVGENSNSVDLGTGLQSTILIDNKSVPVNGTVVEVGTVMNTLPMVSELKINNDALPGYYSKSTALIVDIE
ncbi:hypothetical protein M8A54_000411 [Salmonella enterica]|nr:hypothetical protein [Salmonella enterica]